VSSAGEIRDLFVSLEQVDRPGEVPSIRLEGAASAPMSPAQAMQIAALLQTAAFAAIRAWRLAG